jgi:hypothetical protein
VITGDFDWPQVTKQQRTELVEPTRLPLWVMTSVLVALVIAAALVFAVT